MVKIFHHLNINAPAEKIYEAISTIRGLSNWWTTQTEGSTALGGEIRFSFGKDFDLMRVIADEKNQLVKWEVIDSSFPEGKEQWVGTEISFLLTAGKNNDTALRFEHSKWKEFTDFYGVCNYHWGIFMVSLKSLCETGKGNPQVT